jgi:hypothetical protein
MSHSLFRLASVAVLSLATGLACADSFTSSASSAASKSSGSLSDSLSGSSKSSTEEKKVAEGTYRIEHMAAIANKPDHLRLHLQATATAGEAGTATLDLPRQAVERQALNVRGLIELRDRAYGMEVAAATTKAAFFLLLKDEWRHDMETRAVTL